MLGVWSIPAKGLGYFAGTKDALYDLISYDALTTGLEIEVWPVRRQVAMLVRVWDSITNDYEYLKYDVVAVRGHDKRQERREQFKLHLL